MSFLFQHLEAVDNQKKRNDQYKEQDQQNDHNRNNCAGRRIVVFHEKCYRKTRQEGKEKQSIPEAAWILQSGKQKYNEQNRCDNHESCLHTGIMTLIAKKSHE